MPIAFYSLTLTGAIQRLSDVLPNATPAQSGGIQDQGCRQIILAADPANANVVYIGPSDVSSTKHGFALDPTQATAKDRETIGPFPDAPVKLGSMYAIGTNAQRLMLTVVT